VASAAKIFISYRRDDSAATVGRIYDRMVARFGREAVFKDVDSIPPGVDFEGYMRSILAECAVQLVVIGPLWLELAGADGRRRLDVPGDYVRLEIEAALAQGLPIIPLLVQGAAMPHAPQLPPSIQGLARYNGLLVRYDPDFENDMRRMLSSIERWLGEVSNPTPQPTDLAGQLLAQMRQSFQDKDWPDVVRRADLLIRNAPEAASAEVYRLLGMAALEAGDNQRAGGAGYRAQAGAVTRPHHACGGAGAPEAGPAGRIRAAIGRRAGPGQRPCRTAGDPKRLRPGAHRIGKLEQSACLRRRSTATGAH
jgi:hypothetical protein